MAEGVVPSYFATLFDEQISDTFGFVRQCYKVDQIVKEWEIKTKSSFTPWMADKNFGSIGVFLHIYSFIFLGKKNVYFRKCKDKYM